MMAQPGHPGHQPRDDGPKTVPGVRNILAIASNKGGVGKSTVAVNLAIALAQTGASVGLLDADITGPNIPTMMGFEAGFMAKQNQGLHAESRYGIKVASLGFLLPRGTPVVWRGPMIGSGVRQLLHDLPWGDLDYLIIDLPPGTSDASMTMCQEAPIAGAIIVSTPQAVALEDAIKAVGMFEKLNVPVFGIVENMSYFVCPHCGERTEIFLAGGGARLADELGVPLLGQVPLQANLPGLADAGQPIVAAEPQSPAAQALAVVARRVTDALAAVPR